MAKRFKAALALVIACLGVALFMATPAWALSSEPAHSKTATDNGDGTVTIHLDVTGASETSTTSSAANVYVVVDTSGSMSDTVSTTYTYTETTSSFGTQYGLVGDDYVELDYRSGNWYTPDGQRYSGARYRRQTQDVTRLDVAKQALATLGNTLLAQNNVNVTLIPFATRVGTVSGPYSKGHADRWDTAVSAMRASGGTNWEAALQKASDLAKSSSGTPAYVIFLSDGQPTFRTSANGHTTDYNRNYGLYGTGSSDPNGWNLEVAVKVANAFPDNVTALYSIYNGEDAATAMNNFSSLVTKEGLAKQVYNGTDATRLNNALNNIAQEITNSASYKDVVITDVLSRWVEYALPTDEMLENGFTYLKNNEPWADAPAASIDSSGNVVWDLSVVGKLEDGVTYAIEFNVKLKPEAYQEAAKSASDSIELATNDESTDVAYTVFQESTDGSSTQTPGTATYNVPTVQVPKTSLEVSKTVAGNMGNVDQYYDFTVVVPNGTYYVEGTAQNVRNGKLSFQLKHGETATITGLMPGDYTVSEVRDNVSYMTTQVDGNTVTGTETSDDHLAFSTTATVLNSSDTVTVAYVNTSTAAPIVGFSDNATPFLVLMTVAIAGAGAAGVHAFARSREE